MFVGGGNPHSTNQFGKVELGSTTILRFIVSFQDSSREEKKKSIQELVYTMYIHQQNL